MRAVYSLLIGICLTAVALSVIDHAGQPAGPWSQFLFLWGYGTVMWALGAIVERVWRSDQREGRRP